MKKSNAFLFASELPLKRRRLNVEKAIEHNITNTQEKKEYCRIPNIIKGHKHKPLEVRL